MAMQLGVARMLGRADLRGAGLVPPSGQGRLGNPDRSSADPSPGGNPPGEVVRLLDLVACRCHPPTKGSGFKLIPSMEIRLPIPSGFETLRLGPHPSNRCP